MGIKEYIELRGGVEELSEKLAAFAKAYKEYQKVGQDVGMW